MAHKMTAAVVHAFGGADGVLVTAVSPRAFERAIAMLGRRGTMALLGLPPGTFPLSIFDTVLNRRTIRGSIVRTRLDLMEALAFAGEGKIQRHLSSEKLDQINAVFDHMRAGAIDGRLVLKV
jgi:propanol-preferring alcohol dehydrogenase